MKYHSTAYRVRFGCLGMVAALVLASAEGAQAASPQESTPQTPSKVQAVPAPGENIAPATVNDAPQSLGSSPAQTSSLETVEITATRVQRPGFIAPTPTTVLSENYLQMGGLTDIGQSLAELPSYSPTTSGATTAENVDTDQNTANLRGLGSVRTLVLIDGARPVTTSPSGSSFGFDLNMIPTYLVKRVDVVTGGASAEWGSDAVAGVINIVMNNEFEGFKAEAQYGSDTEGFGSSNYTANAAYGTTFAGERGHIMVGGGYFEQARVCCNYSSPAGRDGLIPNPDYTPTNGQPQELFVQNLLNNDASIGGLITSGPLKGTNFGAGSSISQFQYGQYGLAPTSGGDMVGGDPSARLVPSSFDSLISPDVRENFYGSASYDLSDRTTLSLDLLVGREDSNGPFYDASELGTITISNTNAYLPTKILNEMSADNITSFKFGRDDMDFGPVFNDVINTAVEFWLRAKGDLGHGWTWDSFYSYGQTNRKDTFGNQLITANFNNSVDAVKNPTTGQPVCAIALTNPSTNCVPVDLFGPGAPSVAALNYFEGNSVPRTLLTQHEAAANLRGEPFSIWAGPVSIATGLEFRYEGVSAQVDPITKALGFSQINIAYLTPGSYTVGEGYLEAVAPLARGLPVLEKLDFNGGVRVSDYSTSGFIQSWKLGLTDNVTKDFLLRGTMSRDIRAPNLEELFDAIGTSHINVINPISNVESTQVVEFTGGNPKLLPEKARTWTVGATYQPSRLRGLSLSLDWYSIDIENSIGTLDGQTIVDQCYQAQLAAACDQITTVDGAFSVIRATYINFSSEQGSGMDMEADYATGLTAVRLPGNIAVQWLANYVDSLETQSGTTLVPMAGLAGYPRWRSTLSAMYTLGPTTITARARYYSGGAFTLTQTVDTDVPPQTYLDLGLQWKFPGEGGISLYGNIDDVFNNVNAKAASYSSGTGGGLYDIIGRTYNIGVRMTL